MIFFLYSRTSGEDVYYIFCRNSDCIWSSPKFGEAVEILILKQIFEDNLPYFPKVEINYFFSVDLLFLL